MSILRDLSFEEYSKMSYSEKKELEREIKEDTAKLKLLQKREEEIERKKRLTEEELEFEKTLLEIEKGICFTMREYENFSVHNYQNVFNPFGDAHTKCMAFFTDDELSEIEEYGFKSLIIDCFEAYKDFDIELKIYKGVYSKEADRVSPCTYRNSFTYRDSIYRVTEKIRDYQSIELKNNMVVYYFYAERQSRNNQSKVWKLTHPRKFDVHIFG